MHIIMLGFDSSQTKDILFGSKALLKIALGNMLYPLVAMKIAPAQNAGLYQKKKSCPQQARCTHVHPHLQNCAQAWLKDFDWNVLVLTKQTELKSTVSKRQHGSCDLQNEHEESPHCTEFSFDLGGQFGFLWHTQYNFNPSLIFSLMDKGCPFRGIST